MTTPKQLQYNTLKPAGFATKYKQTRFTPAAALSAYNYNDIVRFMIQTGGYWDPYNAFIKITVKYDDTNQKGVALQLDGSASSLFDQLLITSNSQEIERIEQYDTISSFLHDVNQTEDIKSQRLHEGINAGNSNNYQRQLQATNQPVTFQPGGYIPAPIVTASGGVGGYKSFLDSQQTYYCPTDQNGFAFMANISAAGFPFGNFGTLSATQNFNNQNPMGSVLSNPNKKRHLLPRLATLHHTQQSDNIVGQGYAALQAGASGNALKAKYMNKYLGLVAQSEPMVDLNLTGATIQGPNGQLPLNSQRSEAFCQRRMSGQYFPLTASLAAIQNPFARLSQEIGRTELSLIIDNYWSDIQGVNSFAIEQSILDEPATFFTNGEANYLLPKYMGYQKSYCSALSTGFESFLSSTLPQNYIYNGICQSIPQAYSTKTYSVPIMSALFGVLLPRDSYRYIPMKYFENLLFEFKLSPYAFFTSGNKINPQDTTDFIVAEQPSQRTWQITKMEIYADIYYFDEVVEAQVSAIANGPGIFLHTASWFLGPQYPLQSTQQMIGTWQINMGFESLKMIVMLALDAQYSSYSYCRKQFRLSHNLSSFQLKFGTEYYPPQPVIGNAGNPLGEINNSEFYQMLQKAFGKLNDVWGDMEINPINFAITERPYDPSSTGAYFTASNTQSPAGIAGEFVSQITNYTIGPGAVNTQRGMPWFHENRCIGKALYAMNLEGFPSDDKIISGMNTTKIRPFEIQTNCVLPGTLDPSILMFFLYADIFYVIKPGQVTIFGK